MAKKIEEILSIKVTHANTDQDVYISPIQLFGVYYMEQHKSTALVACGGAVIPVKETVDEVLAMTTLTQKEGETNGEG